MDSTVVAALLGAVVAGAGGLLVPRLIARVPPWEPPPPEDEGKVETSSETDATIDVPDEAAEDPPEPYADIAVLPGLAWRSAVAGVVTGAVVGAAVGWEWAWLLWVPLVPVYLALAVIDWRTRLLPTYLITPTFGALVVLVLVGWAVTGDGDAVVRAGLGFVTCGAFYFILWFVYPRGLGFGDVRLSGLLGLALGLARLGAGARRHVRRLPARRRDRGSAGADQDRRAEGLPVRAVHAAGRGRRAALGRRRCGRVS